MTIGDPSIASSSNPTVAGATFLQKVTSTVAQTLNSIQFWSNAGNANWAEFIFLVYADSAGAPGALLGRSAAFFQGPDFTMTQRSAALLTPVALSAATDYWIGAQVEHDSSSLSAEALAGGKGWAVYTGTFGTPITDLTGIGSLIDDTRFAVSGTTGTTTVNLSVNNATQAHTADNLTLVQNNLLSIQNAAQSHSVDGNLVLLQAGVLTISDCLQAHSAQSVTLTQANLLAVNNALQNHSSTNINLVQNNVLNVANCSQLHVAESVTLTTGSIISVADCLQAQSATNVNLVQAAVLNVANALQGHQADSVALTQGQLLTVQNALQAQAAESPVLSTQLFLDIQNALQAHVASSPELIQQHVLIVQSATQAHSASNINLSTGMFPGDHIVVIDDFTSLVIVNDLTSVIIYWRQ